MQETYRSVESRMAQESLRRHVLRVLRIWRSWFIFTDDFLNGLQVCAHSCLFLSMECTYMHLLALQHSVRGGFFCVSALLPPVWYDARGKCTAALFSASDDGLCCPQATFLRGASASGDSDAQLAAELEALPADELEIRCRRNGLSRRCAQGLGPSCVHCLPGVCLSLRKHIHVAVS
jgi:hypothetical protein